MTDTLYQHIRHGKKAYIARGPRVVAVFDTDHEASVVHKLLVTTEIAEEGQYTVMEKPTSRTSVGLLCRRMVGGGLVCVGTGIADELKELIEDMLPTKG